MVQFCTRCHKSQFFYDSPCIYNIFRKIPVNRDPAQFINRKGFNSLNVLVTGGSDKLIYDLVVNAPGSFHDAEIYQMSGIKAYMETRFPRNICLGDSAFPTSDVLVTPYSARETAADPNKALFNRRHSGARCEMTENLYGIWKRRFPILRCLRVNLPNAYKIIICCAILHNLSVLWGEILPQDDHPGVPFIPAIPPVPNQPLVVDHGDLTAEQIRRMGQETRERMRDLMNRT